MNVKQNTLALSPLLLLVVLLAAGPTLSRVPTPPEPDPSFLPVSVAPLPAKEREAVRQTIKPVMVIGEGFDPYVAPIRARPTSILETNNASKPKVMTLNPSSVKALVRTSKSLRGKASWYCKAGVSVCHHSYPPGSMVAAACGKLRAAMGPHWRGRYVDVMNNQSGKRVVVKLVDWCGSKDKTIDLYWEPMRRLGGSGVLNVTVRW